MAFTKTPENTTYKTQRFNFIGSPQQRNGYDVTKDQRFLNMFPELIKSKITDGKKYYLRKRPGLVPLSYVGAAGAGRGIYTWRGSIFAVIENTLYRDGVSQYTLTTSSNPVGFLDFNGSYDALILLDGVNGYVIKTDFSVTQITSPNFPTPHVVSGAVLDGYLFVVKKDTADIYNSDLDDALAWTSGNFITAEMYPDKVVALNKNNNYVCAFGASSIEYFYDSGQTSGSPLQRNDSGVQQIGCPAPYSVISTDKELMLVGSTDSGGYTIWAVEGFKATEMGIEALRESLDAEGANISKATAINVRVLGHKFYILNLVNRTWVYDFEEMMWHEWSTNGESTGFCCNFGANYTNGKSVMLHKTNGYVMYLEPTAYSDNTGTSLYPISCLITTLKVDFDSINRKLCYRFTLLGDSPTGTTSTQFQVAWSDDDYVSWSATRNLNMNGNMSAITQLGLFRRRAFAIRYNQNYPLRLEGFELDINIGQT